MDITGIRNGGRLYPVPSRTAEAVKTEETTQTPSSADTVSISKQQDGAAYYAALCKNFECVKNGSVSISGAYLDQCAKDPEKAKELEESLAVFYDCVQSGYQNAKMNAQATGGKLVSFSETWSIDSQGNITMISCGTVECETGTKTWKEIQEETLARLKKKRDEAKKTEPEVTEETEPVSNVEADASEETSERQSGKVGFNEGKRARQLAAAASKDQVQMVLSLLRQDLSDCKAGLEMGWCDENEVAKVEAMIQRAQQRLSQVPETGEEAGGLDAFAIASLM